MLINVSEGEECRIALVEDGKLEELYMERTSSTSHVGNIYKGRVTNVEASSQAACIDSGLGRNGFLHLSDLMPTYFGRRGEEVQESVGRKMARRDRPPIQRCLRRGDEIVVQVIKEGIGTKGPTLSSYLSIPGRILVMMPGMAKLGVSKKIEDEEERRRLRQILDGLKPPKDVGFIIRTAGVGKSKAEIQRDFTYLSRLWMQIEKMRDSGPGPMELYTEGDLVTRTVRGVIICDFIDLRYERHRRELEEKLHENFKNDRAKTKVLRMSQFGIIEMTRQRMRPSLKRSIYNDCPHCKGAGLVKTAESMSLDVMRRLHVAAHDQRIVRVELAVSPEVAFYFQNRKRAH